MCLQASLFSVFVEVIFQKTLNLINFCEELLAVAEDLSNLIVSNAPKIHAMKHVNYFSFL